jgi:hypothetical protein
VAVGRVIAAAAAGAHGLGAGGFFVVAGGAHAPMIRAGGKFVNHSPLYFFE